MSDQSPPSVPRSWLVVVAVLYVLLLAYSILILGQLVVPVFAGVSLVLLYVFGLFLWRFLRAAESAADALQRIAREYERD
jgi:Ca2+/Na+ antiporter